MVTLKDVRALAPITSQQVANEYNKAFPERAKVEGSQIRWWVEIGQFEDKLPTYVERDDPSTYPKKHDNMIFYPDGTMTTDVKARSK